MVLAWGGAFRRQFAARIWRASSSLPARMTPINRFSRPGVARPCPDALTRDLRHHILRDTISPMTAISIHELHEHTDLWVRKATEQEPIVLTDNGRAVAKIVPVTAAKTENPFLTRKLLPGYAAIMHKRYPGKDTTEIISDMRDGR